MNDETQAPTMVDLVVRKSFVYMTRDLKPGDLFQATPVDADYFVRNGRAARSTAPTQAPAPAPAPAVKAAEEQLARPRGGRRGGNSRTQAPAPASAVGVEQAQPEALVETAGESTAAVETTETSNESSESDTQETGSTE